MTGALVGTQHPRQGRNRRMPRLGGLAAQRRHARAPRLGGRHRIGVFFHEGDRARLHARQAQTLTRPARQRPGLVEQGLHCTDTRPVQAHPHAVDLHVFLPARNRHEGLAHTQRAVADEQAHVQIEPVRLPLLDSQVDTHPVLCDRDGPHVLCDIPHEAVNRLAVHEGREKLRDVPRGDAPGPRNIHPQVGAQRAAPRVHATDEVGHSLVPHAVRDGRARTGLPLLILRPPAHDDAVLVPAHRPHEHNYGPRLCVEAAIRGAHDETPAQRRQPRAAKLRHVRGRDGQRATKGKALQSLHTLNASRARPTVEQQQPRLAIDARGGKNLLPVARHDPQGYAVLVGRHVHVRVPRRMGQRERLKPIRRRKQLHPRAHQARQPRVRVLPKRPERDLRARMPGLALVGETIPLTQERDVRRIQAVRHRRPLCRRQVKPGCPLRTPRARGRPAQRSQRRLHARVVRVNDKRERLPAALTGRAQHLAQDAGPLGLRRARLAQLLGGLEQRGDGVWAVRAQPTGARQRRAHRSCGDAHAVGQPLVLDARLQGAPVIVPRQLPHGPGGGQAHAVRPGRRTDEGNDVVVRQGCESVAQGQIYHPFSLRHRN